MHKNCDIVVGLVYGDEGKGKITNYLAQEYIKNAKQYNNHGLCIRYNGGPNAGHTVYYNGVKVVTHQVPTGVIWGMKGLIGDNCYVDLYKLEKEIKEIESLIDIDIVKNLYISKNAHIIQQKHILEDSKDKTIGTTGSGIGPCARDKYERTGLKIGSNPYHLDGIIPHSNIVDSYTIIQHNIKNKGYMLVEGAQGFGLDITHGDYPYLTSSHCCATDCLNIGIPIDCIRDIWGVCKAYDTYVGAKQFQNPDDKFLELLQIKGEEFGATTGRPRQCNYLNLDFLIKSININNCSKVIINKCDILESCGKDVYKCYYNNKLHQFKKFSDIKNFINETLLATTYIYKNNIIFSYSKNDI